VGLFGSGTETSMLKHSCGLLALVMVAETETVGTMWLCQDAHLHIATKIVPGLIASPTSRDRNDLCHIA